MTWNNSIKAEHSDFKTSFYESVNLINPDDWNKVVGDSNIYLSLNYLKSLEQTLSQSIQFRYIIFYNEQFQPIGVAVTQILDFVDKHKQYDEQLCKVGSTVKHKLLGARDIKVMVCGDVFSCGENGCKFIPDIEIELAYKNLTKALYRLRRSEKINGQISMVLMKEFWPASFGKLDTFKKDDYREFMIDVNMILKIHESWKSKEDYLDSMKAKFRTKAHAAYKRSCNLEVKSLTADEISRFKLDIERLYGSVLDHAEFQFGELNGNTFAALKENLKEDFTFRAYIFEDKLIGFSTAYQHNDVVDAGYVGIDYNYNIECASYQRILYDYVEFAIEQGAKEIRFGRTAEEIKSSLGAEPVDMKLYVKHRNVVSNKLIIPIIDSIKPSAFELRHPFKADFIES
jgi:hypothetical protein